MFWGAIASIMPGTSSVKSDFSLINWTKDFSSNSLTDLSLESIMHFKQYQKLRDLFEWNYGRFIGFYLWSENCPNLNIEIDPKIAISLISGFFRKQGGLLVCRRIICCIFCTSFLLGVVFGYRGVTPDETSNPLGA